MEGVNELKAQVFDLIREAEMLMVRHKQIQQQVAQISAEIEKLEQSQLASSRPLVHTDE